MGRRVRRSAGAGLSLHILCVGRMRNEPEAALFRRYAARIRGGLELVEIPPSGDGPQAQLRENAALRAALPARAYAVVLHPTGTMCDSAGFATLLNAWRGRQEALYLVIGGAEGLDSQTLARANATLSLGPMVWPHLLARVLIAEQIYRAQAIGDQHPYHRP